MNNAAVSSRCATSRSTKRRKSGGANRRVASTAMPNTARPSDQPVIDGSSSRLTAISTKTSTAAPVNTHHSQPRCGADSVSSAIVAITATPSSTSIENAPARANQDAVGGSGAVSSVAVSGVASSTAVTN